MSNTRERRRWLLRALALLFGTLLALVLLEIALQILPVHGGAHRLPVNEEDVVLRFEPDREFVWSRDWNFSIVNKVKINNFGFASDFEYEPNRTDPLLAVVGDSFVEAFMVPYSNTCTGRLAELLQEAARVYSFAAGGAPLSQYLAYAKYAHETFSPDGLVVVIIGNDFDESLGNASAMPGFHYFFEDGDGELVLRRTDFAVSLPKRALRNSALALYLMHNLELGEAPSRIRQILRQKQVPARGSIAEEFETVRIKDSQRVVVKFLSQLPNFAGLAPEEIVFVVDGLRPHLYDDHLAELARGSYMYVMRQYFMEQAAGEGFEVIDLNPVFTSDFREHRLPFEYRQDAHWNERGHQLCFEEVAQSAVLRSFSQLQSESP